MPEIVLCPKCQVRVGKDNLGELLCPKCGIRLCPKAHIVDGKICPYCGWEDPNYYLWQEAQKKQRAETRRQPAIASHTRQEYKCSQCLHLVSTPTGPCPNCSDSRPRLPATSSPPAKDIQTKVIATPPPVLHRPRQEMQGAEPRQSSQTIAAGLEDNHTISAYSRGRDGIQDYADKSDFLQGQKWLGKVFQNIRDWRTYVKYLLFAVSALVVGAIILVIFNLDILPTVGPQGDKASPQTTLTPISTPAKLYTLSTKVAPEGGGRIQVSPPSESGTFEPGIAVTLIAMPDECYTFSYWEGVNSESSKAITTMDSNKSVTANFRLKDTTPPNISEVKISRCTDISATITWNTDEPAKSQIEYGKTEDYGSPTTVSGEFVTSHSVLITGLEPNTIYYFKVKSQGKCGDEANTFTGKLKTSDIIAVGHEVGKRPPDFTLQEYQDNRNPESPNNGETVSLSDFRGKKILLNFWNTFCGACIGEFPGIRKIYEDADWTDKNSQDSDLVILTVCIDGRADRIEKLEDKYQNAEDKYFGTVGRFIFPILLDVQEKTSKNYNIFNIPCSFFIDRDGIIRDIKFGRFTSLEEIRNKFDSFE